METPVVKKLVKKASMSVLDRGNNNVKGSLNIPADILKALSLNGRYDLAVSTEDDNKIVIEILGEKNGKGIIF